MKIAMKKVYYCEFCKKKSFGAGYMAKHEKHCTANPDRECRMCDQLGFYQKNLRTIIEKYKSRFKIIDNPPEKENPTTAFMVEWIGNPVTLDEILDDTEGCPMCTLAVLRQTRMNEHPFKPQIENYDLEEHLREIWDDYNRAQEGSQIY